MIFGADAIRLSPRFGFLFVSFVRQISYMVEKSCGKRIHSLHRIADGMVPADRAERQCLSVRTHSCPTRRTGRCAERRVACRHIPNTWQVGMSCAAKSANRVQQRGGLAGIYDDRNVVHVDGCNETQIHRMLLLAHSALITACFC